MEAFLFTLIGLCCLSMLFGIYMLYRNERVYKFRTQIHSMVFDSHGDWQRKLRVSERVTYDEMMSFWNCLRPLTLEEWFDRDDIAILKSTTP